MGAHPAYTAGVTVTGGNTGALAAGAYVAARHIHLSQKLCVYPVPFLKHGEFLVENRNFLTSRLFNASSPLGDSTGFSSRFFASKLISFGYRVA